MKTFSVNPEQEPQSSGSLMYRFVLALIIFLCLSYVTFASHPNVPSANEPPVEFTSLALIKVGAKVELKWTVSNEQEVSHYLVEQSSNGMDFKVIAYVFPFEDKAVQHNYSFAISSRKVYSSYYRIKSIHLTKEITCSAYTSLVQK